MVSPQTPTFAGGSTSSGRAAATFWTPGYTRSALGDAGAQEGLNYIHDLIFKYKVWPNPATLTDPASLFASGRLGMYIEGNWVIPTLKTIKKFDWGVAPLAHNTHIYTGYYVDGWFVPKGAPHPDLSFDLIASFLDYQSEDYVVHQSDLGIPLLKSAAQKDANLLFNPLPKQGQNVWLDSINYGHTFPYSPIYNQLDPIITRKR